MATAAARTQDKKAKRNRFTALMLTGFVCAMVGLAFASVPLYRLFCQITGYGGTPRIAEVPLTQPTANAPMIKVRFDANVNAALPWQFLPGQREITVPLGEQTLTHYTARNVSETSVVGTATFNVTPYKAAPYFAKIECFCFTEQRLEPGREISMPVAFFVDPAILDDPNTQEVTTITLSYTFFLADENGDAIENAASIDGERPAAEIQAAALTPGAR